VAQVGVLRRSCTGELMTTGRKARKQFILDQSKIRKAKKILGARTETETVDRALDLIIANDELDRAHQEFATSGVVIRDVFGLATR
jgi:hypothetical protein